MTNFYKRMTFAQRLKLRIWGLRLLLAAMVIYAFVIAATGGGDSRIVTNAAHGVMVIIYFGGILWALWKIRQLKKLLLDPRQMKEKLLTERDERRRYLHDKSGGIVWDALFVCLLFITLTTSLYNMAAFAASNAILVIAIVLKAAALAWYSRN